MTVGVEAEVHVALPLLPLGFEAGQRARLLAHVPFAVAVALAEGEELHELTRVVLVRRVLRVVDAGEPEQHRRVAGDRVDEAAEVPERVTAQEAVLPEHQARVADPDVRRGEPVVPDEGHPLDERPVRPHHPVEPPEVVVAVGVLRGEPVPFVVARRGPGQADVGRMQEPVHGAVEPEPCDPPRLTPSRPESRAPQEPLGLGSAEAALVDGYGRH